MRANFFRCLLSVLVLLFGPAGANALVICIEADGTAQLEFAGPSGGCSPCEHNHHDDDAGAQSQDQRGACTDIPVSTEVLRRVNFQNPVPELTRAPVILIVSAAYHANLAPIAAPFERSPWKSFLPPTGLLLKKSTVLII